jgi:Na+/H+ antiporter NhaD/arsenite permease-like protein
MGEYIAYSIVLVILAFYFFMRFRWLSRRLDKELDKDTDKPKFTYTDILVLALVTFAFCLGHRIAFDSAFVDQFTWKKSLIGAVVVWVSVSLVILYHLYKRRK